MGTLDLFELRRVILAIMVDEGRAPSINELSRALGEGVDAIRGGLARLSEGHVVVLGADRDTIRMVHPFSAAPMAFVVTPADGFDDRRWWGGCAWDSFGIAAALDLDARVDTACPECGSAMAVRVGPTTPPPPGHCMWIPNPARSWWDDPVATCTALRLFCDSGHADAWAAKNPGGQVVDATTIWKVAQPWYGDRLASDYTPHSRERNQAVLDAHGLTGDFWRLP